MGKSKVFRVKNIRWSVFIIAVAGLVLWTAADIFAQQGTGPCAEDAAKYCKDVQPGRGRMAECLKEHENELSAVCKEHFMQMGQRRGIHEACQDDAGKLCRDVKPGEGRIARCLHEHREELSPRCRENLPEGRRGK